MLTCCFVWGWLRFAWQEPEPEAAKAAPADNDGGDTANTGANTGAAEDDDDDTEGAIDGVSAEDLDASSSDEAVMIGWMNKMGANVKSWKRRYTASFSCTVA